MSWPLAEDVFCGSEGDAAFRAFVLDELERLLDEAARIRRELAELRREMEAE